MSAVSEDDGAHACGLLAPEAAKELEQSEGKPCAEAITSMRLPTVADEADGADVDGRNGFVTLQGNVVFVSMFDNEWRVTAAGCTPRPPRGYDCMVKAG